MDLAEGVAEIVGRVAALTTALVAPMKSRRRDRAAVDQLCCLLLGSGAGMRWVVAVGFLVFVGGCDKAVEGDNAHGGDASTDARGGGSSADAARPPAPRPEECSGVPETLDGSVRVTDEGDIERLLCYTRITGTLDVTATELPAVRLPSLAAAGAIVIAANAGLTTVDLPSLTSIEGDLVVGPIPNPDADPDAAGNHSLERLGLPALASIGGGITIWGNSSLTHIDLPALRAAAGDVTIFGLSLTELEMPVLTSVGGGLRLSGMWGDPQLEQVVLPKLARVDGQLSISFHVSLATIELPALTRIGAGLEIVGNCALLTLDLPALLNIDGPLNIAQNDVLRRLTLPVVSGIDGNLSFADNVLLERIDLPSLSAVTGDIRADDNLPALASIELPTLVTVGGDVLVGGGGGPPAGNAITHLDLRALASVGGRLAIATRSLPSLELPRLSSVGGGFIVSSNNVMSALVVPVLATVGGGVAIGGEHFGNRVVESVGLPALTSIGGNLSVIQNGALESLDLPQLVHLGGDVVVYENAVLCQSVVDEIVDRLEALGWNGVTRMFENRGC